LGSAVAAAEHLPGPAADKLLETARDAYTNGVQLAAAVSAVMVLIFAATTAKLVRGD
jgi:DHA2 family multidrug resistance protein-like MFS transporter